MLLNCIVYGKLIGIRLIGQWIQGGQLSLKVPQMNKHPCANRQLGGSESVKSTLEVLSCQAAIRQQGGCNELSVCTSKKDKRGVFDGVCFLKCLSLCVCFLCTFFPPFFRSN